MSRLAGAIDGVIGVDTHHDTLAAAATDPVGGCLPRRRYEQTRVAIVACWCSPKRRCLGGAAGRLRVPAVTAPGWRPSCRLRACWSGRARRGRGQSR